MTDAQINAIIADVDAEVSTLSGSPDQGDANLIQAAKWKARAATLQFMSTTEEMAASFTSGDFSQQNKPDSLIQKYEENAEIYLQKFSISSFSIPSGRMGFKTVDNVSD